MSNLDLFFEGLVSIRDYAVGVALCKVESFSSTRDAYYDITDEVIYRIMEMIDGYSGVLSRCNIVVAETGEVLNAGVELHDACVQYLKSGF